MAPCKCPFCSREMHLETVKTVFETDVSFMPGVYHAYYCNTCHRRLWVPQGREAVAA